ncbi:lipopolysaccharide biosynthesis protein [Halorussus gelatinilyticus]|uniref:Lipopolysaccharide biosynthesis protein n=1 Tax=Halorussus gelatinilyticus TaxID=2937524 RepID=A0A8U0IJY5_9EURY|nr:lipopolysaccharide biosynthesis protein [Halorussus gelatinilyticus]UPW00369.1 lipopolysaccharide biosynthesis protein [Halorussus gelatinilyticus]
MTSESTEAGDSTAGGERSSASDSSPAGEPVGDPVEARLEDALERVAHGATVSVPSILVQRGLTLAFTAVLTNGFSAGAYGAFALARRLQRYLLRVALGFRRGLSRFLPNAESDAERDSLATFAGLLLVGAATVFGAALFAAAPLVTQIADEGAQFERYLRIFAVGVPAGVWLFTVTEILRGLEAVGPLNLTLRVCFPTAQLGVGAIATFVFHDLALAAAGVLAVMGLTGVGAAAWLVRERGFRPRLRGGDAQRLRRTYLSFTLPLFVGGIATTTQRLGFYPLIAVFLSSVAGGVFAVGVLVGTLVRLPLIGINQFIPPVAAALHEEGHRDALRRLYHVTSRLVLIGVTGLAIPVVVYRETVMALFGPTFVEYAPLLPGFVVAQYAACAAGSVGILLTMTDHQRALLVVNVVITAFLAVTAIPLTTTFGLPGLVGSYLLMLTVNNGLEVVVLYYLEGLQPFTRLHAKPLVAGVPLAVVALGVRSVLSGVGALVVGTALGVTAYATALGLLGFTAVERRLAATLAARYRDEFSKSFR